MAEHADLSLISWILCLSLEKLNTSGIPDTRNDEIKKGKRSDSSCKIRLFCSTNAVKSLERTELSIHSVQCTPFAN